MPSTCLLYWGSLNSALNPIAYSMTNREFRKFAFRLICTGGDHRRIKDFTCASSLAYTPTSGLENKSREFEYIIQYIIEYIIEVVEVSEWHLTL